MGGARAGPEPGSAGGVVAYSYSVPQAATYISAGTPDSAWGVAQITSMVVGTQNCPSAWRKTTVGKVEPEA